MRLADEEAPDERLWVEAEVARAMYTALKILVEQLGFNPAGKSKAIKQKREDAIQDGWEKGVAAIAKAEAH